MSSFFNYDQKPIDVYTSLSTGFTKNHIGYHYINAEHVFTKDECKQIIDDVEAKYIFEPGVNRNQEKVDYRNSDIAFLEPGGDEGWIYERFIEHIGTFNSHFKFDLTHLSRIQFAKYAEGQFLDWHVDDAFKFFCTDGNEVNYTIRKLSISVFLDEPETYENGDFQILVPTGENFEPGLIDTIRAPAGTALLFPSFYPHRVTPVTKNIRRSLVCWFYGPTWK